MKRGGWLRGIAALATLACTEVAEPAGEPQPESAGARTPNAPDAQVPAGCPPGTIPGPVSEAVPDACAPVGIPGCHEMFIDAESGLCIPDPDLCPPGTRVNFTEGCIVCDTAVLEARDSGLYAFSTGTRLDVHRSLWARTLGQESDGAAGAALFGTAVVEDAELPVANEPVPTPDPRSPVRE